MQTELIDAERPGAINRAAGLLRQGYLIAYPTDTLYGVGANPFKERAINRLYRAKDRSLEKGIPILLACSALKRQYRERLQEYNPEVIFVYLKGDYELILRRMQNRKNHYMNGSMLQSQFDDLEEPAEAIEINIDQDLDSIIDLILKNLDLNEYRSKHGRES